MSYRLHSPGTMPLLGSQCLSAQRVCFEPLSNRRSCKPQAAARAAIETKVQYVNPPTSSESLWIKVFQPESGKKMNVEPSIQTIAVEDSRQLQQSFSWQENGFQFERLEVPELDWNNLEEVEQTYYPLVAELIKKATGASRVHVFERVLRQGRVSMAEAVPKQKDYQQPTSGVHCDFTRQSGPERLRLHLPEEAEQLQKTPFAIIQVWRPLEGPVDESPLALVDARTVAVDDFVHTRLEFPDRPESSTLLMKYNPGHKFYYLKGMTTSEAALFSCYDSRRRQAGFTPHASFHDPTTADAAPERKSVEVRAFAFWENEAPQEIAQEY